MATLTTNGQVTRLAPDHGAAHGAATRDVVVVVALSIGAALLSVHYELSEALLAWTRPHERFQLDELPGVMLVVALSVVWFAWRRYVEARGELARRRAVEADLARALAEQRELAGLHLRLWDAEQKSLARELHDELGQYLNAIKIDAVSIRDRDRDRDGATAQRSVAAASDIIECADHAHAAVANMVRRLRPVGLDDLGLSAALEHCVDCWSARLASTRFTFSVDDGIDDFGETLDLALYRLLQEGLNNVSKHSQASSVDIRVERSRSCAAGSTHVALTLADDGVGADLDRRSSGLGLIGMRERVEGLGGELCVESSPGQGFRLVARLPARVTQQAST